MTIKFLAALTAVTIFGTALFYAAHAIAPRQAPSMCRLSPKQNETIVAQLASSGLGQLRDGAAWTALQFLQRATDRSALSKGEGR